MANLFIIGNGFDVAHGLKSKYGHFREWLMKEHPTINLDVFEVPEVSYNPQTMDAMYDKDLAAGMLITLIDLAVKNEDWRDFEDALGNLDYEMCMDEAAHETDIENYKNPWHMAYNNEDFASALGEAFELLEALFTEWISSIALEDARVKPNFQRLVNRNTDYFLNFNYTQTAEELYGAENVNHIHGTIGQHIIFGHGVKKEVELSFRYIGADFQGVHNSFKKPSLEIAEENWEWFSSLRNEDVSKIYSYGFSYSSVDEPYIETLCRAIPTEDVVWYLNSYNMADHPYQQSVILRNGFKGSFETYCISG